MAMHDNHQYSYNAAVQFFSSHGINLVQTVDIAEIPDSLTKHIPNHQSYKSLVLLGNAGGDFWQKMQLSNISSNNPVDDFTTQTIHLFEQQFLKASHCILYPNESFSSPIPLQRLAIWMNWGKLSPLKIMINKQHGLWWAIRAVFLSKETLGTHPSLKKANSSASSPCSSCDKAPCISQCPANAIYSHHQFNLEQCLDFRLKQNSSCAQQCLARNACPDKRYKYSDEQITYHYSHSLGTILSYKKT